MQIIKRKMAIGIGREASWGTQSIIKDNIPGITFSIDIQKETIRNEQAYGRIEQLKSSRIGKLQAQYTIEGVVDSNLIGHLLYPALGTLATTVDTPATGANTHAFSVANDNTHKSVSFFFDDDIQDMVALGCVLVSYSQKVIAGEWVSFTAVFAGKAPTPATETATFTDNHLFSSDQCSVRFTTVGGSFTGASLPLTSFDFEIQKNTEATFAINSTAPNTINNKQLTITGNLSLLFENTTYYTLFTAHTLQAMEIVLSGGTIPTTAIAYSLTIVFPQVHIAGWDNNAGNDDLVQQNLSFEAEYNTTGGIITASLVNNAANAEY